MRNERWSCDMQIFDECFTEVEWFYATLCYPRNESIISRQRNLTVNRKFYYIYSSVYLHISSKSKKKIIFSRNTVRNDILENNWRISLNLYTNLFFSKIKLINNASGSPIKTRSTSMGNTNQRKRIRDSNKIRNGSWLSDNGVCRDYACAKLRPRDGDGWEEFAVADVPAIPPPYQIIIMINLRAALLPHTYSPAHKCGRVIFVSSWNWISAFK